MDEKTRADFQKALEGATDAEIKDESFLEFINTLLMTGNIPGLFAKDEMLAITADLMDLFQEERPCEWCGGAGTEDVTAGSAR